MRYTLRRRPEEVNDRRIRLNREFMVLMRKYEKLSTDEELTKNKQPVRCELAVIKARLGVLRRLIHNC